MTAPPVNDPRADVTTGPPAGRTPVLLYLPGILQPASESASAMAELIAVNATQGPGTFAVEQLSVAAGAPLDGRRIKDGGSGRTIVDIYPVDYLTPLRADVGVTARPGTGTPRLAAPIRGLVRALPLLFPAGRRAKSRMAKFQLLFGALFVAALVLSVVLTLYSVLASYDVVPRLDLTGWAVGALPATVAGGVAGALLTKLPSMITRSGELAAQFAEFAKNDAYAGTAALAVQTAVDAVLERDGQAEIHLLGYSFGALVGIEFLAPRRSLHRPVDDTRRAAVKSFGTIGCPSDMLRLFVPGYLDDREPLRDGVKWTNVYIAADVLGSNFANRTDADVSVAGDDGAASPTALPATSTQPSESVRFLKDELTFWSVFVGRGFDRHNGYWGRPGETNCLHLVTKAFVRAGTA